MKIKLLYLVVLFAFVSACKTQDAKNTTAQTLELTEMNRFAEAKIGNGDSKTFQLSVTESSLLNQASKFIMDSNDDERVSFNYKIEVIDSQRFLRLHREDGLITTVAIIYKENEKSYYTGNTVCTSSAKSNGCIPNPEGLYCSKVKESLEGSCTKTSFAYYDSKI